MHFYFFEMLGLSLNTIFFQSQHLLFDEDSQMFCLHMKLKVQLQFDKWLLLCVLLCRLSPLYARVRCVKAAV